MSNEIYEQIQKMNQERTCWNCVFCDGDNCLYACHVVVILNGEESAKDCEYFVIDKYSQENCCKYCKEDCEFGI